MQDASNSATPLIIVGMHRSGTSLVTSLLQRAGMHIGDRLMPANEGNPKGYFENMDFYEFHKAVLRSQGVHEDGWTLQDYIEVEDFYRDEARRLIQKNAQATGVWGWKDPRTTLFLDFWTELLPDAKFLMVYRAPWEIVDSLYRRGDEIFQEQPLLAVKCYQHYNQKIIDFFKKDPERCLLVALKDIVNNLEEWILEINQRFTANLKMPPSNLIDRTLIKKSDEEVYRPSLIQHYAPQAIEIFRILESSSWRPKNDPYRDNWEFSVSSPLYQTWAFRDWMEVRSQEKKNKLKEREIQQKEAQIQQLRNQNSDLQDRLSKKDSAEMESRKT